MNDISTRECEAKIYSIIQETLSIKITSETSIGDTPEWDSFSQVLILEKIEHSFSITFDLSELILINSVSDWVNLTLSKVHG